MVASMLMVQNLSESERKNDKCTLASTGCSGDDVDDVEFIKLVSGKDHTNFLLLLAGFMSAICILLYYGYSTKFRRTDADKPMKTDTISSETL